MLHAFFLLFFTWCFRFNSWTTNEKFCKNALPLYVCFRAKTNLRRNERKIERISQIWEQNQITPSVSNKIWRLEEISKNKKWLIYVFLTVTLLLSLIMIFVMPIIKFPMQFHSSVIQKISHKKLKLTLRKKSTKMTFTCYLITVRLLILLVDVLMMLLISFLTQINLCLIAQNAKKRNLIFVRKNSTKKQFTINLLTVSLFVSLVDVLMMV